MEPGLRDQLERALAAGCTRVCLDARELRFIDSSIMSLLASVDRRLRLRGGRLHLRGLSPELVRPFRIVGLDYLLDSEKSVPEPEPRGAGSCS
jgi:anti-anti-sigma factor